MRQRRDDNNAPLDTPPSKSTGTGRGSGRSQVQAIMAVEPNVNKVMLGNLLIKCWYPSFYPEELVGTTVQRLYVCQWCFKYSMELIPFLSHIKNCPLSSTPPGHAIYADGCHTVYEVDGESHKLYTQNLSLFAKLFLDTKSVFYDVTTFLYYTLVYTDPATAQSQVVGFFSKEKMSWDNNNLACILVFPPWQKQGLGQVLMGVSYELSKREERIGGPERPLSELGRRAYLAYWSGTIARFLANHPAKKTISVKVISDATYILPEDVSITLKEMGVIDQRRRGAAGVVVSKARVRAWISSNNISMTPPVNADAFLER